MQNKTKKGRPKRGEGVTPRQAALSIIANKGNLTGAYKSLHPGVNNKIASVEGTKMKQKPSVHKSLLDIVDEAGINVVDHLKILDATIKAGVGVNATNKDSIAGLKLLFDIYKSGLGIADSSADLLALQSEKMDSIIDHLENFDNEFKIMKANAPDAELSP